MNSIKLNSSLLNNNILLEETQTDVKVKWRHSPSAVEWVT